MSKTIVLFYKKLLEPGGAERLLLKEYVNFMQRGHQVKVLTYEIDKTALFDIDINADDLIILEGKGPVGKLYHLCKFLRKNRRFTYLCASGHIDLYIASIVAKIGYNLHIHHPCFMSFNDYDKFSIFMKKHFNAMSKSNYGAERFVSIAKNMSLYKKLTLNVRALLSMLAIKKAINIFVLSEYARKEKELLYGVDSLVMRGGLDSTILDYLPKPILTYDQYKNKILTVARLDRNKRIDVLIKAFAKFLSIEPSSVLLIGGRGPELENLISLSVFLGIEEHVVFLGFIPENELYDYYYSADMFVTIDWADYIITELEVLSMGTKIVASNEREYEPDVMNSGYVYPTKPDIDETFQTMLQALKSTPNLGTEDLRDLLRMYTWENYCNNVLQVICN